MTARRLFALLTLFVMFHLTLVGPDDVCAEHGRHASPGHMGEHGGHHAAPEGMPDAPPHQPCETPASSHCCDAMTSCALTLAVAERGAPTIGTVDRSALPASRVGALLSRSLAPEPPPPKA